MIEIRIYCPLCVDYFKDIKKHTVDNHHKKIIDIEYGIDDKEQIVTYKLPFLNRQLDRFGLKINDS